MIMLKLLLIYISSFENGQLVQESEVDFSALATLTGSSTLMHPPSAYFHLNIKIVSSTTYNPTLNRWFFDSKLDLQDINTTKWQLCSSSAQTGHQTALVAKKMAGIVARTVILWW